MNSPRTAGRAATARERARAELTREIKEEARRQLVATGAEGLSLRAVAKELGMVSSALYRYYPSRDELLTALIIDAYNALGAAAEHAIAGPGPARERWTAACHAIRDWARSNPQEYALVYGSPVPGYRAPDATIGPASRVPLAFAGVVRDALAAGELAAPPEAVPVTGALAEQAAALSAALAGTATSAESSGAPASVPPDALVRAVIAWTQLYGMISFELFGQFVGSFEPADALFAYTVAQLTAFVGLHRAPLGERFTRSSARRYSRSVNKQERTYTVLRDRIHSGAFAPRARLNIDGLARELGVSAIPVREALRRLEAEGWVKFQPNVGAIVAPVDATAWEQQMVAVAILEGAATADAAANLRTSDMTKVRGLAAEMEQVAAEGDLSKFSRLNRRLHATIFARCANTYLLELLEQTNQRLDRIRDTMFTYLPERSKAAIGEHAHLIELLEGGDPEEIERYARWHKLQTVAAYRATREPPR